MDWVQITTTGQLPAGPRPEEIYPDLYHKQDKRNGKWYIYYRKLKRFDKNEQMFIWCSLGHLKRTRAQVEASFARFHRVLDLTRQSAAVLLAVGYYIMEQHRLRFGRADWNHWDEVVHESMMWVDYVRSFEWA